MNKELLKVIEEVEKSHFRTNTDTGSNLNALVVMNAFRREAGLPYIGKDDLPRWNDLEEKYVQPIESKLLHKFSY